MQKILIAFMVFAITYANPTPPPDVTESTGVPWWEELESSILYTDPNEGHVSENSSNTQTEELKYPETKSDFAGFSPTTKLTGEPAKTSEDPECNGPNTHCVPYYQCRDGQIISDGSGAIDIRFDDTVVPKHSNCGRYLEVCCRDPDYNATVPTTTVKPPVQTCGVRNSDGVHARITGLNDTQTQFGEFPWMVAVLRIEKIGDKKVNLYLCGGSLIAPNIVLTAAHCVKNFEPVDLKVRAGEWDTQSEYEVFPHQDRFVNESFIHPEFNGNSLWNDFAILILESPLELNPSVSPICLPEEDDNPKNVPCIATGWGKDRFGIDGRFQNILKQVTLTVIPHAVCENALRTTRLGEYFLLDKSFLCAGGMEDVDTCKGDGGSPLICPRSTAHGTVYYQAGIVAWGIGCGENGIPGVYANVFSEINWIKIAIAPFV